MEVSYEGVVPELSDVRQILFEGGFEDVSVRPFGESGYMIQTQSTTTATHQAIFEILSNLS